MSITKPQVITLYDERDQDTACKIVMAQELGGGRKVVLENVSNSVSDAQRAYYRKTVLPTLLEMLDNSYSAMELDGWLKTKFGDNALVEIDGEALRIGTFSTSNKGNAKAMAKFLDAVLHWAAASLGCYIPEADKEWRNNKDEQ